MDGRTIQFLPQIIVFLKQLEEIKNRAKISQMGVSMI